MTKPIILVTGATGQQGGGVVNALLADGTFAVRGLTRNTESSAAKALKEKGVEVVQGDADNYDSILKALEGAHGAFFVTNYWEYHSFEREIQQAKNYAQAAKASGLKHAVWSTLDDTRNALKGKLKPLVNDLIVPHVDGKAIADQEFISRGVPTTFLLTSFYYENFVSLGMGPKKGPDGKYKLSLPLSQEAPLFLFSVGDVGIAVVGALKKSSEYINKWIGLAGDRKNLRELAQEFSQGLGIEVTPETIPREVYLSFGFPGVQDLANMFAWFETPECLGARSIEESNRLSSPAQFKKFGEWLEENKEKVRATL